MRPRTILPLAVVSFLLVLQLPQSDALTCVVFVQTAQVCSFGQGGEIIGCDWRTWEDYRCSGGTIGYPNGPNHGVGGGGGSSGQGSAGTAHGTPATGSLLQRLNTAKTKAIAALQDANQPQCGDIASDPDLGQNLLWRQDVVNTIQQTIYRDWSDHATCSTSSAFTTVNHMTTYLCKNRFLSLSARQQAAILIHEALHAAGLKEKPTYPEARRTSQEITQFVLGKCPNM